MQWILHSHYLKGFLSFSLTFRNWSEHYIQGCIEFGELINQLLQIILSMYACSKFHT
jgi:hypothetical protein